MTYTVHCILCGIFNNFFNALALLVRWQEGHTASNQQRQSSEEIIKYATECTMYSVCYENPYSMLSFVVTNKTEHYTSIWFSV